MSYLDIFWLEFYKTIVIFETSTFKFIGSAFSKGPESTFSEGLGPDPGPRCKICPSQQPCQWDHTQNKQQWR